MATKMTNANIWDTIRKYFPSFASHTSEATSDLFTERGFEALTRTDAQAINEFFLLSVRVRLMGIDASHASNRLEAAGFGETYDVPFAGIIQRIAVDSVKPVSPAYRNLESGKSVDPFVVRKPVVSERFFRQNFDYQSFITIPDESQRRDIFISEYGMSDFTAGIMEGLENGYKIQTYLNTLEAINTGILSATKYPLKDTQKMAVSLSDTPTDDELRAFILAVNNAVSAMELDPQSDAFNSFGFCSTQDRGRLKLLIRPGIQSAIRNIPALNAPGLGFPVDVIEVPNFGGIQHFADAAGKTALYPHYDSMGAEDGWSTSEGGDLYTGDVYTVDPNASTVAILADSGIVFRGIQSPYSVEPIRNPRGLYTNFWASSPKNTIAVDPIKNAIVFQKA